MTRPAPAFSRRLVLAATASLVVVSCSSEPTAGRSGVTVGSATMDLPALPGTGAVKVVVSNGGTRPDVLVAVSSSFAEHVSVHRSTVDAEGRSTMVPVERLEIPAQEVVRFEAGGLHVMVTGLPTDLAIGDEFPVDFDFERAGRIRAQVEVTDPREQPRD